MFQRLKGFNLENFLDSKIAEEQERQRNPQQGGPSSARRTPSSARRAPNGRTDSPSKRPASRLQGGDGSRTPLGKGPDPSEFVIEDDDMSSRASTPKPPVKDGSDEKAEEQAEVDEAATSEGKESALQEKSSDSKAPEQLSDDVRQKLRKLEKLESRYHDLLRSYRIAHARVTAIEPFEAALRENTPLTSINEPTALVEYLSQINLKGDMVMDELKRVTGDRDTLKVKLEEAEKRTKDAYDEAAGLRRERDAALTKKEDRSGANGKQTEEADPLGADKVNDAGGATGAAVEEEKDTEDFFSYESEAPRLQAEVEKQSQQIEQLSSQNATLKGDLETAKESYQKMVGALEEASKSRQAAKDLLEREKSDLQERIESAEKEAHEVREKLANSSSNSQADQEGMQEQVGKLEAELAEARKKLQEATDAVSKSSEKAQTAESAAQQQKQDFDKQLERLTSQLSESATHQKRAETLDNLVKTLRDQLKEAEKSKKTADAELNKLREKLSTVEKERDSAQEAMKSKHGHEAAVATLKGQLKKAERDRDDAYQMILSCGKCDVTKDSTAEEPTAMDVPPAEEESKAVPTSSVEESKDQSSTATPAAKKKNKNKKKKKGGNAATPALEPVASPAESPKPVESASKDFEVSKPNKQTNPLTDEQRQAIASHILNSMATLARSNDPHDEEREQAIRHLEGLVEEKDAEIGKLRTTIEEQEAAIDRLDKKLKGEEELREEIEGLKDDLLEVGNEHVAAKDLIKTLREQLSGRNEEHDEALKQLEQRCNSLKEKCAELEAKIKSKDEEHGKVQTELESLKSSSGSSSKALEDKLAAIEAEKKGMEDAHEASKKEIEDLKTSHAASGDESEKQLKSLQKEFDELKTKSSTMQTDLSAANELAQTRYKDLTALREHLSKVQPELKSLRDEVAELKKSNEDLKSTSAKLGKLEAKEKDLRSEIALYKTQVTEKDQEIKSLRDKLKESTDKASSLDTSQSKAQKDLQRAENAHKETRNAKDKLSEELKQAQDELIKASTSLQDLEQQVSKFSREASSLREELELKAAQQASAQSLMDSMQDQTRELATQMKEVRERCESLEEELADAHRLLSERSREGETMRRLLADVEGRADARVKEMRERMDLAIEERDRAEDEASTAGRRRAREIEELKNRVYLNLPYSQVNKHRPRSVNTATFQEAIATFFSCSGKLYHVFTRAQVDRLYNDIFHNSKQSISKAALCELCSVAAVGTLYSQEAIPEGVGKLLYRVSKALLDDCIEANSLQASKVCSLLAQYTILTKATVALAYVEFGLSLARRNGVHSRYVPPGMSRDTWIDGKKAWRTLLFFGNWLSSTLGCISSDESLNSKMNLKDVEIDGERDIADLVQTEMAKIALLKVEIVRTNLAFKELSILSIKNITDDLRKWYTELPPAMYLANLTQHADIPAELRRTIYFVHLLYLGALMLLYRRVVCHYVQQDHRNMFINPLNEVSQYADQGVVAAKQTARILHLLRSEDGIFKRCWLVIIAQKQVHGFTADQWADDLEQAEKCLDALNFCAQVDQVAQGYHDALSPYYERFKRDYESQISSSPPGLSDLSTIDSVGSDHVVSPGPTPSSYLLTFPSKGSSHSAAAESLLDMVCKPFGSSANPTMEANAACGWSLDPDRCSAPPLVKSPRVKRESLAAPKWGGFYGVEHEGLATNMLGAIQQSR
ncbi:hypothetical protein M8818_007782 [Zalaria obscura]|uniref:Uncharacterized protein n=1 Tax=Zalaria obscura TaxID=2024903 RepID=A0ACC3S314_9PEZI